MKVFKIIIALLIFTSCSLDSIEDCKAEKKKVNQYYDELISEVKSREYWSEGVITRVEKDRESALNRLNCN